MSMKQIIATIFAVSLAVPTLAGEPGSRSDMQKQRYKDTFKQLDTNQDEALSRTEASAAGLSGSEFDDLDKDGNGQLSQEEFMKLGGKGSSQAGDSQSSGSQGGSFESQREGSYE